MVGTIVSGFIISGIFYLLLNTMFYPYLLSYQSGSNAARYINQIESGKIVCTYLENSLSFAFYINQPIVYYQNPDALNARAEKQEVLVFTSEDNIAGLEKVGFSVLLMQAFPRFHISKLTVDS